MALSAIEAKHIRKTYTSKSGEVGLRDLSLHVAAGQVLALLRRSGRPLLHLGLTKGGAPRHPLYVAYASLPELWVG